MECFHRESTGAMSEEPRERNKLDLAIALARGTSISAWARANDVAKETARRWSLEPEVRAEIEAFRRRAIDRAVGVFAGAQAGPPAGSASSPVVLSRNRSSSGH